MLFKQSRDRVSTSNLNKLVRAAIVKHPPPMFGVIKPKIFFATQVSSEPPTIVLICNEPKAFQLSYRRYLLSTFRDHLRFGEVPIKVYLQKRRQNDARDSVQQDEPVESLPEVEVYEGTAEYDELDLTEAGELEEMGGGFSFDDEKI